MNLAAADAHRVDHRHPASGDVVAVAHTARRLPAEALAEIGEPGPAKMMVASGRLKDFRACCASVKKVPKKGICIDREAAELLEVDVGDAVVMAAK